VDFKKDDINPYLSKAPRKNKILEMLMASAPIVELTKNFATGPKAGAPVNYSNKVLIDQKS
jgi:hypothetical protein